MSDLTRDTLRLLAAQKMPATPQNYTRVYKLLAQRAGVEIEQANTQDDFCMLSKALLRSITKLFDAKAAKLAHQSLERLDKNESLDELVDLWVNFELDYSDEFLKKLQTLGLDEVNDLKELVDSAYEAISKRDNSSLCRELAPAVATALSPSLDSNSEELSRFLAQLHEDPLLLKNSSNIICSLTKKRMEQDRDTLANSPLVKDLDNTLLALEAIISNTDASQEKVLTMRNFLGGIEIKEPALNSIKDRLLRLIMLIEGEMSTLKIGASSQHDLTSSLQNKVEALQAEIKQIKTLNRIDFTSKLSNKEAMHDELIVAESRFKRFDADYAVALFDIDNFAQVNANYGHQAGDMLIAYLGSLLKQMMKSGDVLGRYGGGEFMVIRPHARGLEFDITRFCHKVEEMIFDCMGVAVSITISGALAQRRQQATQTLLLEKIKEGVQIAKNSGRNNIVLL